MSGEADRPNGEQPQRQLRAQRGAAAGEVIGQTNDEDAGAPRHVGNARVLETE